MFGFRILDNISRMERFERLASDIVFCALSGSYLAILMVLAVFDGKRCNLSGKVLQ